MPTQDEMDIEERLKYLRIMRKRYAPADREGRGRLLDEMEQVTGLDRKTLIRRMKGKLERKRRRQQRGRTYGPEVDDALRVIAESFDHIAAERLTPNLVWMAKQLGAHGEIRLSPELLELLGQISVPTVRRILQRITQDEPRLPRRGPERANQFTRDIPMRVIPWHEKEPGHFEVDLVHHGGPTSAGVYVHTVQMVDVATGWSERVAVLGRGFLAMRDGFQHILLRLPFPVLEVHPDNGSEFFNAHLLAFWAEQVRGLQLSRSRPFQKNDNRFVEQKNSTLVRAYLGDHRLDTVAQCRALNALYDKMWVYYNLFQPVMRLCEKTSTVSEDGSLRYRRRFDRAQTPFDRLCATEAISASCREELERLREQTNPRQLRKDIEHDLAELFALPGAVPGTTENVLETLFAPLSV
ncbi:MAG: integrase [Candidatus Zipacnadales bacterium]